MQISNFEQFLLEQSSRINTTVEALNAELATLTPFVKEGVPTHKVIQSEIDRLNTEIVKASSITMTVKISMVDGAPMVETIEQTIVKRSGVTTTGTNTTSINGQVFTSAFDAVDYIFPIIGLTPKAKRDYDAQVKLFGLALQGKFSYARGNGIVVDAGILVSGEDLLTEPMKAVYAAWLKAGGVAKV
jgi:hypothetical protein